MDLILWRHAEAEDLSPGAEHSFQDDMGRPLTARGEKQALRMAAWLDRQLPEDAKIFVSPARRCAQTALALGRKYKVSPDLAPDATPMQLLELVQWPTAQTPILVIGHQPILGQTISTLLGLQDSECSVKKGSLWWLRSREREGQIQAVVVTVQSPASL